MIGPGVSIYDRSEIRECKIKNSVLMGGVKLEKVSKTINNSIIGEEVEISGGQKEGVSLFVGQNSKLEV